MTRRQELAAAVRPFAPSGRLQPEHIPSFDAFADALGLPRDGAAPTPLPTAPVPVAPLAWGASVSPAFRDRVRQMARNLASRATPDDYMACMAWESGRSFSPSKMNMAGSGATGLIQFMPSTARSMGTTTAALSAMTAEKQLDWVEKYFAPFKGRLNDLGDLYMAILWPKGVGKPMDYVLWDKSSSPITFRQNSGLDTNKDGVITKAEAVGKVYGLLAEGKLPRNLG